MLWSLHGICAWTRISGIANSAPGFTCQPAVINGFTNLIVEVFGTTVGAHDRSALGLAELSFKTPVEIEAKLNSIPSDA